MKANMSSDVEVLFVGHLFPDWLEAKILEQEILPIQTQRFGLALLDALRAGFEGKVEVLSTAPLLNYPHSRLLFAPSGKWRIDDTIPAIMVSFVNLLGLKHITRFIATLAFVFQWTLRNRKYERIIILHGVQSCKIWGVLLGQVLARCITVPFLTDDLGIALVWERAFVKKIRQIDVKLMKRGLQKVSGVIAMTEKLAENLAPGRPKLIMPAIQKSITSPVANKVHDSGNHPFTIVYAGGLFYNYGISLLLDAFRKANRPDWRLMIAGKGNLESVVRQVAENNPKVQFLGFLDSKSMKKLYQTASVLVNPRLISTPIAELSFPSKIAEYLSTGIPVVSTDLPVFNDDFRRHLIIARSDTPEELIRCLEDVSSWSDHQRESWRTRAIEFVQEELSPKVQGTRIRSFVESLRNSVIF